MTHARHIASVGSPSSNYEFTLDLTLEARNHPLVGAMLAVENPMGDGSELALGTVTEIVTSNRWHEDPAFRGVLADSGDIPGMSGDEGDTRKARIRVQAAWRRDNLDCPWKPSGPSLRMSPATGTPARVVTADLVHDLTSGVPGLTYAGHLMGTQDIPLPMSLPDYSTSAGAWHGSIFGLSGSGKTQVTALLLAGKMNTDMSMVIVDPQGQWASEQEMVFSLQGFAAEMGRDVRVHRISDDLRLAKDAPLFTSLLQHTRLVVELGLKHESTQEIVWYEITKALRERTDWTGDESETLLRAILSYLAEDGTASRVYTTPDNQARFQQRVTDLLADTRLFQDALHQFAPIHNLFQETNAHGNPRHSLAWTLRSVFSRNSTDPASLVVLDMSTRALPGMDDDIDEATEQALAILDSDTVKAAILRNLFHTLKRESEKQFRDGRNLNTMIVLDEAWRYAAPPAHIEEEEIATLSRELAGYARDTRKFGIGWLYITQSTRSLNTDIWSQLSVRVFGYGLTGGDLDRASEVVDDPNVLRLYRTFANPRQTGRYPFMLTGPVSPLAANSTPVMMYAYTDFDTFRVDNDHWIAPARARLGLPVLTGNPTRPAAPAATRKTSRAKTTDLRRDLARSGREATGNRRAVGLLDTAGFGDPLSGLDDDPAPF